jgi:predicted transcriptional regulator
VYSLEWRRSKVLELSSQGHSQPEIARILQISQPTVNRDIGYLRGHARQNLQKHIQDKLPEEYQNCMTGIMIKEQNARSFTFLEARMDNRDFVAISINDSSTSYPPSSKLFCNLCNCF